MPTRWGAAALALWVVSFAGCALDESANTHGQRCSSTADCTRPLDFCHRGFCVPIDGSTPDMDGGIDVGPHDGGPDTNADGGPDAGTDGGSTCDAGGGACTTGQPGVCADGTLGCGSMGVTCVRSTDPTTEHCNGDDDDCDGVTDEEVSRQCYTRAIGCTLQADGSFLCAGLCRPGVQTCASASLGTCMGETGPASNEACTVSGTAFDEDCDGSIDEDCLCTAGDTQGCFEGAPAQAGVGVCMTGTQTCAGGAWGACSGDGAPSAETCTNNGADDDCNGRLDDIPGRGTACTIPERLGDCADGTMQCMGPSLACDGPDARPTELCDHHDDNCDGAIDEVFDFATDDANCGGCGIACGSGSTCCNGRCVDTSTDAANCSACLTDCSASGDDACCGSMCADTQNDPLNCGACGNVCSGGQLCCSGDCIDPLADPMHCNGCGMECTGGASACCGGTCRTPSAPECTGCAVDCTGLTPAQECCSNSCADTETDERNCGSCGHACTSGEVCCGGTCETNDSAHCGGACRSCGAQLCCNDACVAVDSRNCQACGTTCATGTTCCATGCRNTTNDDANCGGCGMACGGTTSRCSNGHCCAPGRTWCGSACVNLQSDGANCGSCGHSCLLGCNGSGGCNLI